MKTLALFGATVFLFAMFGFSFLTRKAAGDSLPPLVTPSLVVKKKDRALEIYDGEKLIKTYKIALGFEPTGEKVKEGDGKTPEGQFYVAVKNPNSKFYLSLGLSYPNAEEAARGLKAKLISQTEYDAVLAATKDRKQPPQNTALGGDIYIHGGGTDWDWTWGCIALENEAVKELFDALEPGTSVTIKP